MRRRLNHLIWMGLGISLLIALLLSPFSSPLPDGLEKVSQVKGFSDAGREGRMARYAPLRGYALPVITEARTSAALSGVAGTLGIFFIMIGIGKILRRR